MEERESAWNWYRVRAGYRKGYIAGFLTCGGIVWIFYAIGLDGPATMTAVSGGALIMFGIERIAARIASKDYHRFTR